MGASQPVFTLDHLHAVVEEFLGYEEFVFDVETKGQWRLDPRRNDVFWIGLAGPGARVEVIPFGHPVGVQTGIGYDPRVGADGKTRNYKVPVFGPPPNQLETHEVFETLKPLFWSDSRIIGANIKFDITSCAKYWGGLPPGPFGDIQTLGHLLDENARRYKVGELLEREIGRKYDKSIGIALETYAFKTAAQYCHYDVFYEWLLWKWLSPDVEAEGLGGERDLDFDLIEALAAMETAGIPFDRAAAEKLDRELDKQLVVVRRKLFEISGGEWNLNSNPQKQQKFFGPKSEGGQGLKPAKMTKGGKTAPPAPSTDNDALEVHAGNPLVDVYMEYAELTKVSSTYIKTYLGTADRKNKDKNRNNAPAVADDGRVHPNFRMTSTVTGRLSCSEPNLQNIPRPETDLGKQLRSMFLAPPGHKLIVADYKQVEYVIMAHFSGDPLLMKFFDEERDFHSAVASMILQKPESEVTKPERTIAKNTNFAVAYGAGMAKIASMSHISEKQAKEFIAAHKKMLPTLYNFSDEVVGVCRGRKPTPYVKTLLGRKRRLYSIRSRDDGVRMKAERQAVNTVIQGSASDINKVAAIRLFEMLNPKHQTLLTVHDEFVISVPEDEVEEALPIVREAMVGAGVQEMIRAKIGVDIQAVDRWSEAKD